MAPRETENNAYAKFWGDKQRTLWYVMVFLEWSIPITSVIPDSLSCTPDSKAQDSGSTCKFFSDSGFRYMGRYKG